MIQDKSDVLWGGIEPLAMGPMVRANSAALRWVCLHFGADMVYSEEILAQRASNCQRQENRTLNTVDFVRRRPTKGPFMSSPDVVFRTHNTHEKACGKCVLQLGASDAVCALQAAKVFENDVAAIDINMGCAKHFAVSQGMGAQLMCEQKVAVDIVKTLRRNLGIPVSVKTRIFTKDSTGNRGGKVVDAHRTKEWVQLLQSAGASQVTVHARSTGEKMNDEAHHDVYPILYETLRNTNTYMLCNGDIFSYRDIKALRRSILGNQAEGEVWPAPGLGFMLARAALWDPSVFRNIKSERSRETDVKVGDTRFHEMTDDLGDDGPSTKESDSANIAPEAFNDLGTICTTSDLLNIMTRMSALSANCLFNTKYLLQHILAGARQLYSPAREAILAGTDLYKVARSTSCEDFIKKEFSRQGALFNLTSSAVTPFPATVTQNAQKWPGLVSTTSHVYKHSYFDNNYYTAFRKVSSQFFSPSTSHIKSNLEEDLARNSSLVADQISQIPKKFAYAAFSAENMTIVTTSRRKKPKRESVEWRDLPATKQPE